MPSTIWHGTADTVHPPSVARFVASRIPHAILHLGPGLATFDFLNRREDMLAVIAPGDQAAS